MEPSWIVALVAVGGFVMSVANAVFTWHSNKNRAQRAEIEALKKDLTERDERRRKDVGELRDRVTEVETVIKHLPNQSQIGEVYDSINGVGREVSALGATLKAVSTQVARVETYLLNEGKK